MEEQVVVEIDKATFPEQCEGKTEEECYRITCKHIEHINASLPKGKGWIGDHFVKYESMWLYPIHGPRGVILAQRHFNAVPTDILLTSFPKSGNTWFKALIFSIVNRHRFENSDHPLLTKGPHDCIPFIEAMVTENNHYPELQLLPPPRLFATHIPYPSLPKSVIDSGCRIVYVCRNPKDVLVSKWHFLTKLRSKDLPPFSLEEAFELFCEGVSLFGSIWDHVLEYWNASLQQTTNKVLFLHYEDMKRDPLFTMKKLSDFLGHPFSISEEKEGAVDEIIRLCSFDKLSNLEVNKTGVKTFSTNTAVENKIFFRKGQVGDSKNHLTPAMVLALRCIETLIMFGMSL